MLSQKKIIKKKQQWDVYEVGVDLSIAENRKFFKVGELFDKFWVDIIDKDKLNLSP